VYGDARRGYCDVRLEGHGRVFRVLAERLVEEWERA
jgi:hypothetical protein